MNIEKLMSDIIPPSDYQHRDGFSNDRIISNLSEQEKVLVEIELLKLLMTPHPDYLVGEALSNLKSIKALPFFYDSFEKYKSPFSKLCMARLIFNINHDESLIDNSIDLLHQTEKKIGQEYSESTFEFALSHIYSFKTLKTYNEVGKYTNHSNPRIKHFANTLINGL